MTDNKWERLANRVPYPLHKGYIIHNTWARRMNRFDECVYDVDGKEKTLRQLYGQTLIFDKSS